MCLYPGWKTRCQRTRPSGRWMATSVWTQRFQTPSPYLSMVKAPEHTPTGIRNTALLRSSRERLHPPFNPQETSHAPAAAANGIEKLSSTGSENNSAIIPQNAAAIAHRKALYGSVS
jgi:hypothetical protein